MNSFHANCENYFQTARSEEKVKLDIFVLEGFKAADEQFRSDIVVFTSISDTDGVIPNLNRTQDLYFAIYKHFKRNLTTDTSA